MFLTRSTASMILIGYFYFSPRSDGALWVYGPAGSGKSVIAHTIADLCEYTQLLAAFFFSKSDPSRNNIRLLLPPLPTNFTRISPTQEIQFSTPLNVIH